MGHTGGVVWRPEQLREARLDKEWTQGELAERVGVTREALARWEATGVPRADRIYQLAVALEIDVGVLVELTGGLRELRMRAGLTQLQLAAAAGVPRSTVQALERGIYRVNAQVADAYAQALGVPTAAVVAAAATESS